MRAKAWTAGAGLAAAGVLQAWSLALPWSGHTSGCLQVLAMCWLVHQVHTATHWQQAAVRTWWFATAWLTATFAWLYTALHTFGGLPAWLAIAAVVGLAAVLALYYAAAGALYAHLKPAHATGQALLWGVLWMMAELARAVWFTGFGWGGVAYAHVDSWLAAWAPGLGAHGMAAVAAMLAMALRHWMAAWNVRRLILPLCLLLPALWQSLPVHQGWSTSQGQTDLTLLQGNIAQDEKFQAGSGVPDALTWYGEQLLQATRPLTIAPETAIPLLPEQLPPGYEERLRQRFALGEQAALIGMPLGSLPAGYTNAVIGLKPGQTQPWQYDKHHLVPFGEFIPPWFRWFTELMNIPLGSFNRGGLRQPSFVWQGQTWGVHICFEDLFGEELAQRFLTQPPSVFVNVSNIAWFGHSQAPDQHLAISRLRALEFERPFVRATNTGMTAVVDHRGQVLAQLPRFERGALHAVVEGRAGTTPYAWWVARWWLWPLWAIGLAVVLICWQRRRPE